MKSATIPRHSAAILPSPVLLWRLKVFFVSHVGHQLLQVYKRQIGWDSVMRISADLQDLFLYEAFLYYNPLLIVTMMVWLWGVNLWVFAQSTVNYAKIFDLDHNHLTHQEIWKVCYWVISSNLILRCTWTYKLSAHLRHNYLTVFTITALEIFRHFQWIFFRVEGEWNKMTTLRPSLELAMDDNPKEDNRLLGSSNHGVNKLMLPIPAPAIPFSFHWILMALQHFV